MKKLNICLTIISFFITCKVLTKKKKHTHVMVDFSIQDHEHLNNICN
ncbi:hypothetical protein SPJ221_31 [Staphylococcus phage vB_SauH_SPJ2]|nr:hypothetical protein LSA2308_00169 [Staphylococcus phage LSA2308]USZ62843.1 hypothetical protein LSA2311_orf00035 [Staphylococcus phage LSA2311]WEW53580.1 hypothetical protein SPJ221_31 [Staphylococcus phage vB_SauH_SPJ2]